MDNETILGSCATCGTDVLMDEHLWRSRFGGYVCETCFTREEYASYENTDHGDSVYPS